MSAHKHDEQVVGILLHADENGQPCFGCYFGELFDSFSPEQLTAIVIDEEDEVTPEDAEFARRLGGGLAHVADAVVYLALHVADEGADFLVQSFVDRMHQALQLQRATPGKALH